MKTVKVATNLRFQNRLFYVIEAWCEFVFVTRRTSLNCDVSEMIIITIITSSGNRMIEVDFVKISFQKVYSLKSYRPKHPSERYYLFTRFNNNIKYYSTHMTKNPGVLLGLIETAWKGKHWLSTMVSFSRFFLCMCFVQSSLQTECLKYDDGRSKTVNLQ